ncbi:MAG: HAD family hydrolase [Gammaproteobacteria bacterium]
MSPRLLHAWSRGIDKRLVAPRVVLFDWHATLVDTLDAMYHAVDDMLPRLPELGLVERLVPPGRGRSREDARLVEYVRKHLRLHPKIKAARRISRTDIYEVLFGADEDAKRIAHHAFNDCYRQHYGEVHPFEGDERDMLLELREFNLRLGILTNRNREFLEHELAMIEGGSWVGLFDTTVCGDDTARHKPAPDPVLRALANLGVAPGRDCWYVGDSTTDVVCANRAGITSVFFNGAGWDEAWLDTIFPGTDEHPHRPAVVVDSFREFVLLYERILHISNEDRHRALEHAYTQFGRPA